MADEVEELIKGVNEVASASIRIPAEAEPKITMQGMKKKEIPISVRIDPEMLMKIDQYIEKRGGDRSKLIRNCVSIFFEGANRG